MVYLNMLSFMMLLFYYYDFGYLLFYLVELSNVEVWRFQLVSCCTIVSVLIKS